MRLAAFCAIIGLGLLGACATNGDPRDPLEPLNRSFYTFNDGLDTVLIKPAAEVYQGVIPPLARTGVSNFFSNLNDVTVTVNNLLQGKFSEALSDAGRLLINSTAGLFGLFDVATPAGLEKHDEDFGQTLGWWGVGDGPYLVLPFLGPRTTRDAAGLVVDWNTAPVSYVDPVRDRNQLVGLALISNRAQLLSTSNLLSVAALDEYEFLRDAYLQRRRNLIHDGNPPHEAREKDAGLFNPQTDVVSPATTEEKSQNSAHDLQPSTAGEAPRDAKPDGLSQSADPAVVATSAQPAPTVRVWLP
jgi:phospholipid-binding lipoprotein MlaA